MDERRRSPDFHRLPGKQTVMRPAPRRLRPSAVLPVALTALVSAAAVGAADGQTDTAAAPPRAVAPFDAAQARAHQRAWAAHLGTTVSTTNSVGIALRLIPPGEFLMGSSDEQVAAALAVAAELNVGAADRNRIPQAERPWRRVVLTRPYRIAATEVTIGQFRAFVQTAGYVTETEELGGGNAHRPAPRNQFTFDPEITWAEPGYAVTDDSPVTQVTWNDAAAFCNWLSEQEGLAPSYRRDPKSGWTLAPAADGYRLPTEAQWEFACRAGTTTQYCFGDDVARLEDHAWFTRNSSGRAQPVGRKSPNPFGLFDMHGNAREWCHDWYDGAAYAAAPAVDPLGPDTGSGRVLRGGNWFNKGTYLRSAYRYDFPPTYRSSRFGFRVVRPA